MEGVQRSPAMQAVVETLTRVAASEASVLIFGESGTGKERLAARLHAASVRRAGPFVVCDCSALPPTLIESELFGHAKGAYTGAGTARAGLFREADRGTILLDEIGELEPPLQSKLLRVIQERQVRPVGSDDMVQVDVRVVATTHRDLPGMVKRNEFRQDLYYRLAVVPLRVPPLRERLEDLPVLAAEILASARPGRPLQLTDAALAELSRYAWPGNVRELENVLTRAAILCPGDTLDAVDLPRLDASDDAGTAESVAAQLRQGKGLRDIVAGATARIEKEAIASALNVTQGSVVRAAKLLGVSRATFYNKMAQYGLQRAQVE